MDATAVHAAVREFKRASSRQNRQSKSKQLTVNQAIDEKKSSNAKQNEKVRVAQSVPVKGTTTKESTGSVHQAAEAADPHYPPLVCDQFGGPSVADAQEMVYWHDIPSDTHYLSPFYDPTSTTPKYMTFEPDGGGTKKRRKFVPKRDCSEL